MTRAKSKTLAIYHAIRRYRLPETGPFAGLYWRLNDDHTVSPVEHGEYLLHFSNRMMAVDAGEPDPWRVAFAEPGGAGYVSTVFTGLNTIGRLIRDGDGPFVFETMARIGPRGEEEITRRSTSWENALAAHADLVAEHRRMMEKDNESRG